DQILEMMAHSYQSGQGGLATLVSTVVLLIGATGFMGQLQVALNHVWEIERDNKRGALRYVMLKRVLSFVMVMAVAVILLFSLILTTVLTNIVLYFNDLLPGDARPMMMM